MGKTASVLIGAVVLLLSIGIVMLASTSSVRGSAAFDDPNYFLKRQLVWLVIALFCGILVARLDYHWWQKLAVPVAAAAAVLLLLVLIPGIGTMIGGGRRWLRLGPFSLQPSEPGKFAVIVLLAWWMARVGRRAARFREGLLYPLACLGLFAGLMILEPDFGTTLLTGVVGMTILYAGGARIAYLVITAVGSLSAFFLAVMQDPVRLGRILAFLMPEKYPVTAYHLAQSKIAFIRGGVWGVGLGESLQKQFYLPEAHTDFIFAIIGEELGFLFTGFIVLLFMAILICGIRISGRAPDPFGRLLAFGLTMMITIQAAINIGVVTGCLPTKGLPLPFISYGGTSLVMSVVNACVLVNIASHAGDPSDRHTHPIKDRADRF